MLHDQIDGSLDTDARNWRLIAIQYFERDIFILFIIDTDNDEIGARLFFCLANNVPKLLTF